MPILRFLFIYLHFSEFFLFHLMGLNKGTMKKKEIHHCCVSQIWEMEIYYKEEMIRQNILHIKCRSSVYHSVCPLPLSISLHVVIAPCVP